MDSIYEKILDRIYRINRIYVGHFPDENGQNLSPSAKHTCKTSLLAENKA